MIVRPVELSDLAELHELYTDPRVWEHYPSLRFTDVDATAAMLDGWIRSWDAGLGPWTIRTDTGEFVGHAGAQVRHESLVWNIGYRIGPRFWGRGIVVPVAANAVREAHQVAPDRPVIAYMLEHNEASWRTAERIGLRRVWSGPDAGNPDPTAVRLVYADRDLGPDLLRTIVESG